MALEDENKSVGSEAVAPAVDAAANTTATPSNSSDAASAPNKPVDTSLDSDPFMRALGAVGSNASNPLGSAVHANVSKTTDKKSEPVGAPTEMPVAPAVNSEAQQVVEPPMFTDPFAPSSEQTEQFPAENAETVASSDITQQPDPSMGGTATMPLAENVSTDASAVMGSVITVNNTQYAASVFWQPLQNSDNPLPEIRDAVVNVLPDADLYVLRTSGVPQYGLGISAQGHKAGMPVAALSALAALQDTPSAVAVFKVPEGWWFLAVRNDLILAEEDVLYANEEDAKRNFLSMMAVPDWGRKIAPASWEIDGAEEVGIDTLFANAPKVKLVKLKKELSIKAVAIGVAVVVLLGFGIFTLVSRMFNTSEVIQEVIAPPPVVKPVVEEPKVIKIPMPWESLVVPSEFVKVCSNSANILTSSTIPG